MDTVSSRIKSCSSSQHPSQDVECPLQPLPHPLFPAILLPLFVHYTQRHDKVLQRTAHSFDEDEDLLRAFADLLCETLDSRVVGQDSCLSGATKIISDMASEYGMGLNDAVSG